MYHFYISIRDRLGDRGTGALGKAVLGKAVLGKAVLGKAVLGKAVLPRYRRAGACRLFRGRGAGGKRSAGAPGYFIPSHTRHKKFLKFTVNPVIPLGLPLKI